MFKSLLCFLFVAFSLSAAEYNYNLHMSFKRGPTPHDPRSHVFLNKQEVFCPCGKPPVCTMFFYGKPEHYCAAHIPEIEYVRPIGPNDIEALLRSIGSDMNMNGAHQGMEKNGK